MKHEDMRNAFGEIDPAFERRALLTIERLTSKEEKIVKWKMSYTLIAAALLCLMLAGLAVAAQRTGLFDYLAKDFERSGTVVSEEIETLIERPANATAQNEIAAFTVREALYDGRFVHLLVDAKPMSNDILFIAQDSDISDWMSDLGVAHADSRQKIKEFAEANGKTRYFSVNYGSLDDELWWVFSAECDLAADGTMSMELTCEVASGAPSELPMRIVGILHEHGSEDLIKAQIDFALTAQPVATASSEMPTLFEEMGVRVDSVEMTVSAMVTDVQIRYSVLDKEKWLINDFATSFELLDANGQPIPMDLMSWNDGTFPLDEVDYLWDSVRYVQTTTLAAMPRLPDALTLRGVHDGSALEYQPRTIKLTPNQ